MIDLCKSNSPHPLSKMATIMISIIFTLQIILQNCLVLANPILGQSRETLEIIIGGGSGNSPPPPPENQDCPPPPPPPPEPPCPPPQSPPLLLFESKRVEIAYYVIQKFKSKITHDPFGIKKTWVGSDVCNKYKGFHCAIVPDLKVQALAAVDFNQFNFDGPDLTLDGFLDELPDITIFHANSNKFKGTIPKKIANLRYLYELDLSNNNYNGEFPYNIVYGAKKLYFLDLRFNSFSGLVPPQVFLQNLDVLFINDNNLMQKLPDNLGSTPVLYLTLANNKFTGPIPRSIGQACKTLREVLFLNNQLTGCLPYEIGLLNKATVFDVSRNQLTGKIPHSFGCLAKMQILNLAQNQFYGPVPELVCKLSNLKNLSLTYNYFTEVGPECKKLIQKKVLDVRMNCIPGLPMQRSAGECAAFFCKPRSCPDEKSLGLIPCSIGKSEQNKQNANESVAAQAPTTYSALKPHSL